MQPLAATAIFPFEIWNMIFVKIFQETVPTKFTRLFGALEGATCRTFRAIVLKIRKEFRNIGQCESCLLFLTNGENGNVSLDCGVGLRRFCSDYCTVTFIPMRSDHYIPCWCDEEDCVLPYDNKMSKSDLYVCDTCRGQFQSKKKRVDGFYMSDEGLFDSTRRHMPLIYGMAKVDFFEIAIMKTLPHDPIAHSMQFNIPISMEKQLHDFERRCNKKKQRIDVRYNFSKKLHALEVTFSLVIEK